MVSISGIEIKFGRILAAIAVGVGLILLYKHFGTPTDLPKEAATVVVKDPEAEAQSKVSAEKEKEMVGCTANHRPGKTQPSPQ